MAERSLARRFTTTLTLFGSVLVIVMGVAVHMLAERQERVVWHALLQLEKEVFRAQLQQGLTRAPDAGKRLNAFAWPVGAPPPASVPAVFRDLPTGVDDDLYLDDREYAHLVTEEDGLRITVVLDITSFEVQEDRLMWLTGLSMLLLIGLLHLVSRMLAARMLGPVRALADGVARLDPTARGARLDLPPQDAELAGIAQAIDGYLARLDGFVQREHEFIASASHELRTPVAVIAGATELLMDKAADDERCAAQLNRITQGIADLDETITALLYLASAPGGTPGHEGCRVDELLPGIVRDHEHLLAGKPQRVELGAVEATPVAAPARVVFIAVGNLLRNAIQHGHAGTVSVSLTGGVLRIADEGPGMTPEQVARAYSAGARQAGSGRAGGLGLVIVQRIAQRQGWTLRFDPAPGHGTAVSLDFRAAPTA